MHITPYLFFNGRCAEAFKFYEKCLGAKIVAMITHAETPAVKDTPPDWQQKIIHARLLVGDQMLMGSDAPPDHYQKPQGVSVTVSVDKPEDAERIHAALGDGGEVSMPIAETFWARRFGMVNDKFGISWMINCEKPMK
jgi:PhnB protein